MKKRLFSLSILLSLCGCAKELVYDTIIDEVPVVDNTFVNSNAIQKYARRVSLYPSLIVLNLKLRRSQILQVTL